MSQYIQSKLQEGANYIEDLFDESGGIESLNILSAYHDSMNLGSFR